MCKKNINLSCCLAPLEAENIVFFLSTICHGNRLRLEVTDINPRLVAREWLFTFRAIG